MEPTYLEKASSALDEAPDIAFVSCGMRSVGEADEVWFPPEPELIASLTRGVVHVASMMRRTLWETVGGFDEAFDGHEDLDFWTSVLAAGFKGRVLPEALLRYRVRAGSRSRRAISRTRHVPLMERFYTKHWAALVPRTEELLLAKERFILEQREHRDRLLCRAQQLEQEIGALDGDIASAVEELRRLGRERVELGDLRRTSPISPVWGLDRGKPLDRYYIEQFLDRHRRDIRGRVIEVKDSGYTQAFGDGRVTASDVIDIDPTNDGATLVTDLARADTIPEGTYDCFILTQTLGVIFDVAGALAHARRVLKPGGVLLCTVPAAGRISYEEGLDGDFWRFTEASIRRLFADVFPVDAFEVTGYGNVLAGAAFLYGLAPHELSKAELDAHDPYFPVVYGVRAVNPEPRAVAGPEAAVDWNPVPSDGDAPPSGLPLGLGRRTSSHGAAWAPGSGVVLMYHSVSAKRPGQRYSVALEEFRSHMQAMSEAGCHALSLDDLAEAVSQGVVPPRALAVTLDDGYVDALDAARILSEFSIPATFFVVGEATAPGYRFWWDVLEDVFALDRRLPDRLQLNLAGNPIDFPVTTSADRQAAHDRLTAMFYTLGHDERQEAIGRLLAWAEIGTPAEVRRPMSASEVCALASLPGVSIGAHSESHCLLPLQPADTRDGEIVTSRLRLETLTGRPITSFAYPYGAYDEAIVEAVRRAGYRQAVTTEERPVRVRDDRFRLPRCDASRANGRVLELLTRTLASRTPA
jgi:peptidoglycan/xylan/chitin deacetylase (PgdA/CDA1 family)